MTTNMVLVLIQHPLCPALDDGYAREFEPQTLCAQSRLPRELQQFSLKKVLSYLNSMGTSKIDRNVRLFL